MSNSKAQKNKLITFDNFLNEEHHIINFRDVFHRPFSAEHIVQRKRGNVAYLKKDGMYIEVDSNKSIPSNTIWLKPEDVEKSNQIQIEINKLKDEQDKIFEK